MSESTKALIRIADAIEEILRLVKEDQENQENTWRTKMKAQVKSLKDLLKYLKKHNISEDDAIILLKAEEIKDNLRIINMHKQIESLGSLN